jgi:tetratricopeptide (TPR) repeat protein
VTVPSREEIEAELERVIASPGLARSPQLAKFIKYIVEAKLAGNEGSIKAYSVAVDVFGRPASFDPQTDPIVRVQARRLRAALDAYYLDSDSTRRVRIYLPVGRYLPEFEYVGEDPVADTARRSRLRESRGRSPVAAWMSEAGVIMALVVVALGIAVMFTNTLRPPRVSMQAPTPPHVIVSDFLPVKPDQSATQVPGLAIELVTDLELFQMLDVGYADDRSGTGVEADTYYLGGIVRSEGGQVRVTASLRQGDGDVALWSDTVTTAESAIGGAVDDISRAFAQELGSRRGPLHRSAIEALAGFETIAGYESEYVCELLFALQRDRQARPDVLRASDCVNGLLAQQPESARALAMSAAIATEQLLYELAPGVEDPTVWEEVEAQFVAAVRAAPTSSLVWELYGRYLDARGRSGPAEIAFSSALQLNPANLDARAAYGRMLLSSGASARGVELAQEALMAEGASPPWYHASMAIEALRNREDVQAMLQASLVERTDTELASVVAAVAARRQNAETALNRALAQLLEVTRFKRFGILPVLRQRIRDAELVAMIAAGLTAAGVTEEQLNRGILE